VAEVCHILGPSLRILLNADWVVLLCMVRGHLWSGHVFDIPSWNFFPKDYKRTVQLPMEPPCSLLPTGMWVRSLREVEPLLCPTSQVTCSQVRGPRY
jgi:hypothetical protein